VHLSPAGLLTLLRANVHVIAEPSKIVYFGVFSIKGTISMETGPLRIWASARVFDGNRWKRRWKLHRWNTTHR